MCFIECLKLCRALHKLGELWDIEYGLIKEGYKEGVEQRGIDPGHEVFQVTTDPSELKMNESGEKCACWQRVLVFQVGKESDPMVRDLRLVRSPRLKSIRNRKGIRIQKRSKGHPKG